MDAMQSISSTTYKGIHLPEIRIIPASTEGTTQPINSTAHAPTGEVQPMDETMLSVQNKTQAVGYYAHTEGNTSQAVMKDSSFNPHNLTIGSQNLSVGENERY